MHRNNIVAIGLLLICVGGSHAWDSEAGMDVSDYFNIVFNSNLLSEDINNPSWYSPILNTADDWCVKFEGYFIYNNPDIDVTISVEKWEWREAAYQKDYDTWVDSVTEIEWSWTGYNTTVAAKINPLKLISHAINNNTEYIEDFTTVNDDGEHPDILKIDIDVDGIDTTFDCTHTGYMTFTDESLQGLSGTSADYGFGEGKGAEGGSGGIYEGLSLGGAGEGVGDMGSLFELLFWVLIPLIFMLCVFQLILRAL